MRLVKSIPVLGLVFGAAIATAFAGGGKPPLEPPIEAIPQPKGRTNPDPKMAYFLVCAKECDQCALNCDLCTAHCAEMIAEGSKEHLQTLRTCQDCSAICAAAARVSAKNGPHSDLICTACADACKRCGDACAKYPNDPIMKQCADECRKCEETCRNMLKEIVKMGETPH